MAYNLAEVLEQNVDKVQRKKEKDLGLYVSNQLADDYARLSPTIYEMKRNVAVVPENKKEIMERFSVDVSEKNVSHKGPKTVITIPLLIQTEYDQKTKKIDCEGNTTVDYEMNVMEIIQVTNKESWDRSRRQLNIFGDNVHFNAGCQYGKQAVSVAVKGTWTYQGKVESVTVKIPSIPEKVMDFAAQAQLRYFQILTEAKQQGYFPGQTLSQPELRFLWIPRPEDFEVEIKVEEMEIVKPDPALILRVDKKYDHVIGLWHTETEEPLEFLVRRHSTKK